VLPENESVNKGSLVGDASEVADVSLGQLVTRLFELFAGAACLILLAPIFLFASIAIKFDSRGPIFIRELRYGYKNRTIQVRKFRATTVCWKGEQRAPRLTPVGRILRQTGIEDLPMLINVLTGGMSIIGPPPSACPTALLNERKPGITRSAEILRSQNHAP
jgi:lipopolysaccharide/colanic/teichoic acid biosynthesis glycosyltransferase